MNRLRWLQVILGIAVVAVLLWRLDLGEARDALGDARPVPLVSALFLNVTIAMLFGLRSHIVLRKLGHRLPLSLVLPIAIVGNVAGALTPASSGEVLRGAALRAHADVPPRDALALVLYERGVSLFLMIMGVLTTLAWVALPVAAAVPITAAAIVVAFAPLASPLLLRRFERTAEEPRRSFVATLRDAAGRLRALFSDPALYVQWAALTVSVFAVTALQYWLLADAIGGRIGVHEAWLALGLSQLAAIVSLIPLGIGSADSSLAALLDRFGMTLAQGAAVALLVRALSVVPLVVVAFACYLWLVRRAPASPERAPAPPRPEHAA